MVVVLLVIVVVVWWWSFGGGRRVVDGVVDEIVFLLAPSLESAALLIRTNSIVKSISSICTMYQLLQCIQTRKREWNRALLPNAQW